MRRNAPAGEDLKQIKETIKGMRHKEVTVQEFVGSISQYTGDNGKSKDFLFQRIVLIHNFQELLCELLWLTN